MEVEAEHDLVLAADVQRQRLAAIAGLAEIEGVLPGIEIKKVGVAVELLDGADEHAVEVDEGALRGNLKVHRGRAENGAEVACETGAGDSPASSSVVPVSGGTKETSESESG